MNFPEIQILKVVPYMDCCDSNNKFLMKSVVCTKNELLVIFRFLSSFPVLSLAFLLPSHFSLLLVFCVKR